MFFDLGTVISRRRNFTVCAAARQIANEHYALTKTKQLEQKLSKNEKMR